MNFFRSRLEAYPRLEDYRLAKAAGYWPYYKTVESASRPRFTIEGADYINFGSNNYLSLSYHPDVIEAAQRATSKYGTGVTGSRLLNGTLDLHRTLEAELAEFYGREAALVFSTGYVANVATIGGLLNRHDYAILDKDAHNSLLTGAQLSGATMKRFGHNDLERLARILDGLPPERGKGVIVDGVYSMGGDTAPLDQLVELCHAHPNTFLLDDEAHGLGVLGARGRGAAERYDVLADVDLITITFSKTLGSCGGALIGSPDAIELLMLDADPLIFTASNTPGSVAAALEALRILRDEPEITTRLRANVGLFIDLLTDRGVPVNPAESAILTIPLRRRDEVSAVVLARELLEAGVFVNPVVAPAVAQGLGLIRLSLMLDHTPALLEEAAEVIFKVLNDNDQLPEE
ncbi:MAG TPA: aminotransferase class I/II-fold pyridoxal phosphate-dependent enzyme [Acidimicrobiia bacterium]